MATIQPLKTVTVELSHPHSLRLIQELEQVKAIKLITNEAQVAEMVIPDWHKDIVRKRVATSKDTDFTPLDEAFKKLKASFSAVSGVFT